MLLLLFGAGGAAPSTTGSVAFDASLNFSASARLETRGAVAFTGAGTLAPAPRVVSFAAVSVSAAASLLPAGSVVISWPAVRFSARGSLIPTVAARGKKRRVIVTDAFGAVFGEVENAKVGPVSFELNRSDEWSFALPIVDEKAGLVLDEKMREAQLWRGDLLLSWGPMVRPAADKKFLTVTGAGADWHLTRRHIGKAERTNYLWNGDFEDGPGGWHISESSPLEPRPVYTAGWSWQVSRLRAFTGERSLRMDHTFGLLPKYGISAKQQFLWEVDPELSRDGDDWVAVAYCFIPSAQWARPHYDNLGLKLARYAADEFITLTAPGGVPTVYPKPIESVEATIDDDTPRDQWVRLECVMKSPPTGRPEWVKVELACPIGRIYWDRVSLTLEERLAFYEADQTSEIAAGIVEHLQDPDYDKSDVNIATACPPSGVLRDQIYPHDEHPNGFEAIEEFTKLDNGFDFATIVTPTTRTFTTYAPQRGTYKADLVLELGRNLADFAWAFDGEAAASSMIVLGQGNGPSREEGFAIDPTAFAGGLTLEEVFAAPPDTPIDALDNVAIEKLAVARYPEILALKTNGRAAYMIGRLWPGDTVPVRIRRGALDVDGIYRVIRLTVNENDSLDLVVNRRDPLP